MDSDIMSFADFDRDGRIDIGRRNGSSLGYAMNMTPMDGLSTLTLDIVDAHGGHTQYGRVVRVRPRQAPSVTYTRVVDGGSSLLSLNQYPILIGTPYDGDFDVTVRLRRPRARLGGQGRRARPPVRRRAQDRVLTPRGARP